MILEIVRCTLCRGCLYDFWESSDCFGFVGQFSVRIWNQRCTLYGFNINEWWWFEVSHPQHGKPWFWRRKGSFLCCRSHVRINSFTLKKNSLQVRPVFMFINFNDDDECKYFISCSLGAFLMIIWNGNGLLACIVCVVFIACTTVFTFYWYLYLTDLSLLGLFKIGRASCRERV